MNPTSSSPFLRFLCLFTIFISFVAAIKDGSKSYLVTFDKDTPQSVVNKAANDLRKNGANVNHVFTLIKGFSVEASPEIMEQVRAMDSDHVIHVEEDQVVHAMGNTSA